MSQNVQLAIVVLIVLTAATWAGWQFAAPFFARAKSKAGCDTGCGSCGCKPAAPLGGKELHPPH